MFITFLFLLSFLILFYLIYSKNCRPMDLNLFSFRTLMLNEKSSILGSCFVSHRFNINCSLERCHTGALSVFPTKSSEFFNQKCIPIDYLPPNNFSFYSCDKNFCDAPSRSLIILFAWLFAKERHLDKYRKLYTEKGFDILTIKVNVKDFIIPQAGSQIIAACIVKFLNENNDKYSNYLFHAFSVGAYQMGELFVMLDKEIHKNTKNKTKKLLKGLIFDSAMDLGEAPLGLSKATTTNRWLQWAISSLMYVHLRLSYHLATKHYVASSRAVHQNKFRLPTLVLLSKNDEVANPENQFAIIDKWRQEGIDVQSKCWEESPHVSHFFKHPDEYKTIVHDFIDKVIDK